MEDADAAHKIEQREYSERLLRLENEIEKRKVVVRRLQAKIEVLGGVPQDILAELNDDSLVRIRPEDSFIVGPPDAQNFVEKERTEVEIEGFGKFKVNFFENDMVLFHVAICPIWYEEF